MTVTRIVRVGGRVYTLAPRAHGTVVYHGGRRIGGYAPGRRLAVAGYWGVVGAVVVAAGAWV